MFIFIALKGLAIGLSISMPIGPVGVLCVRRSLALGRSFGLVTGLGAATADLICACVTGFGLTSVSELLLREKVLLGSIGGGLFCALGVGTFFRRPVVAASIETAGTSLFSAYASALFLTVINPLTLLSLVAIFSGLGMGVSTGWPETLIFITGIFLGAVLWWLLLSSAVTLVSGDITPERMNVINRFSGSAIFILGMYLVASSLR